MTKVPGDGGNTVDVGGRDRGEINGVGVSDRGGEMADAKGWGREDAGGGDVAGGGGMEGDDGGSLSF
ncbi:hypothetical protein Acr_22g0008700 [Actinidia rufa]|uniref:Uncharacterized protein n=1 Tax=Actinidia rufa TaxID=165716 RepID=A0A7J0GL29_9ERIC|nr:hypothetical protein Acr_22g0008700 [Actinidia rufa]